MGEIIKYISDNHLGDLASIAGVLIALIGFGFTIFKVLAAKKAAQQAEEAVRSVKEDISRINTVADFSSAVSVMEEIKRLQRQGLWNILPDRYDNLRKRLIEIKGSGYAFSDEHKKALQSTIQHLRVFERSVEADLENNKSISQPSKYNTILTGLLDRLQEVLVEIRQDIGS